MSVIKAQTVNVGGVEIELTAAQLRAMSEEQKLALGLSSEPERVSDLSGEPDAHKVSVTVQGGRRAVVDLTEAEVDIYLRPFLDRIGAKWITAQGDITETHAMREYARALGLKVSERRPTLEMQSAWESATQESKDRAWELARARAAEISAEMADSE